MNSTYLLKGNNFEFILSIENTIFNDIEEKSITIERQAKETSNNDTNNQRIYKIN